MKLTTCDNSWIYLKFYNIPNYSTNFLCYTFWLKLLWVRMENLVNSATERTPHWLARHKNKIVDGQARRVCYKESPGEEFNHTIIVFIVEKLDNSLRITILLSVNVKNLWYVLHPYNNLFPVMLQRFNFISITTPAFSLGCNINNFAWKANRTYKFDWRVHCMLSKLLKSLLDFSFAITTSHLYKVNAIR